VNEFDPFIVARTVDLNLDDGTPVRVRPIVPTDRERIEEGLRELSPESRYLRFLRSIDHLTNVDYFDHFAWVALDTSDNRGMGVARYARLEGETAEAAVVVLDRYQHRGLGAILLRLVAETAYAHGIRRFRAWAAPRNTVVMRLIERWHLDRRAEDGTMVIDIPLPLPETPLAESSLYESLREVAAGRIEPYL